MPSRPAPDHERNLDGWARSVDRDGKPITVPLPRKCGCGAFVNYGREGRWWCTHCWQNLDEQYRRAE